MNDSDKPKNTISYGSLVKASLGLGNFIGVRTIIYPNVIIGSFNHISDMVFIPPGVTIQNHCFIGPGTIFTNDKYPPSHGKAWRKTVIYNNVSIGANCTILPGIAIYKGSVVGAGSVVTKDVQPGVIVCGSPAKFLKFKESDYGN